MATQYWAASSRDEIANHILEKKTAYLKYLEQSGIMSELRKSYSSFFGNSAIDELEDGKTVMTVNHYASLVRSLQTFITQNRPAFEARALNSDYESQAVTILANGLFDYYLREQGIEELLKQAVFLALYLREGWIVGEWDVSAGSPYAINPDTQTPVTTGDVKFTLLSILDVIRPSKGKQTWHILRRHENKFDLAAKFPDLADKILSADEPLQEMRRWSLSYISDRNRDDDDNVEILTLIHDKTPALPAGRLVTMVGDTVLTDNPLPYKKPYVFAIKAADAYQTNFGHSPAMDLIPIQSAIDTCYSIALSNINSFGIGSLVSEKGTLQVNQLREGLLHLEHSKGSSAPTVLNLLQIPKEILNFADSMIHNGETISSVNSVARGNVPGQMSGTAMALIAQQALVFSSGLQQSYNSLIEQTGTALIELLQTYAQVPMVAQLSGKTKKSYMDTFKSDDLQGFSKFIVDASNAFTKTTAGKVEVANNLLQSGLIANPQQYLQVVTTGTLEPLVEHDQSQLMLIRQENELLAEGQPVQAVMTDNESLHVLEHSCVINDPNVRQNPQVLAAALGHIQEHINNAGMKNPALAQMLKQIVIPQPTGQVNPEAISGQPPQDMMNAQTPNPAQPPQ